MFNTIKNALKTPDIRKRLCYTLLLIVIFRLGCFISVPTVNSTLLTNVNSNGITQLINTLSGGAFSRFSIFAMSITPYITASIVIQLLGMVIPSLERLTKEGGEAERAKINRYTKILTLFLAFAEGLGIYLTYQSSGIFMDPGPLTGCLVVVSFIAGTSLLMWLGEQITTKGIGNGISMLIFVGIISGLPNAIRTLYNMVFATEFKTTNLLIALAIIIGTVILVTAVVFVQQAERKIQYNTQRKLLEEK